MGPFRLLATTISADNFLGRILTGRVASGSVKPNQTIKALARDGSLVEQGRVSKVLAFRGLERVPIEEAVAGDIVSIAGLTESQRCRHAVRSVRHTPIEAQPIDPPTISMTFRVNDSPLAGTEGSKVTSRLIWDRLQKEAAGNVACRLRARRTQKPSQFREARRTCNSPFSSKRCAAKGLSLACLARKWFTRPVTMAKNLEPIEEVVIDVDDEHSGVVVQKMSERKAEMLEMKPSGAGRTRLVFDAPTRGLIGYQGELLSDTRGTAIMNRVFKEYGRTRARSRAATQECSSPWTKGRRSPLRIMES